MLPIVVHEYEKKRPRGLNLLAPFLFTSASAHGSLSFKTPSLWLKSKTIVDAGIRAYSSANIQKSYL